MKLENFETNKDKRKKKLVFPVTRRHYPKYPRSKLLGTKFGVHYIFTTSFSV